MHTGHTCPVTATHLPLFGPRVPIAAQWRAAGAGAHTLGYSKRNCMSNEHSYRVVFLLSYFAVTLWCCPQVGVKTLASSAAAGAFRIFLMPVDTVKTIMQVQPGTAHVYGARGGTCTTGVRWNSHISRPCVRLLWKALGLVHTVHLEPASGLVWVA